MIDNLAALRARDDLLAVAASWGALRARLRPSGGNGTADRVQGTSEPRLPIDLPVSDLLHSIETHARFLGQVLLEEVAPVHGCGGACHGSPDHRCAGHHCATDGEPLVLPEDCPTRRDPVTTSVMPDLLVQVAKRYGHFTADPDEKIGLDFCDEAHELRRKVSGTLAKHEPARWQGPCPEDECVGEIYQRAGVTDAKCRACGRVVGPAEWRAIMHDAFEERLMTRSELVSALVVVKRAVKPNTLDRWVSRGRLVAVVVDPDLFQFAHAYELAERYDTSNSERMSA